MQVIPVIDVRHGVAVRAVAGDRSNYRPLTSPLAASASPDDVARGYMRLHPFPALYLADLDGIEGRGCDTSLPERLSRAGAPSIWVDAGVTPAIGVEQALASDKVVAVLGSESGWTAESLSALPDRHRSRIVLSLDFRGQTFLGDNGLLSSPAAWPARVIVMTLSNVGTASGPNCDALREMIRRARSAAPAPAIYAAGGIRNAADLASVRALGAAGALVASALHAGTITASDLG